MQIFESAVKDGVVNAYNKLQQQKEEFRSQREGA